MPNQNVNKVIYGGRVLIDQIGRASCRERV